MACSWPDSLTVVGSLGQDFSGPLDINQATGDTRGTAPSPAKIAAKKQGAVAGSGAPKASASRPFQCHCCPQCFVTDSGLKRHMRTHTGERPFRCGTCSLAFSRKDRLRDHERCHANQWRHACHLCPKTYTRKNLLRRHVLVHHS